MSPDVSKAPKGFKKQVFGVILIFFGAVNTILNIKTDISVDAFDLLIIVLGGGLLAFGAIQKNKGQKSKICPHTSQKG